MLIVIYIRCNLHRVRSSSISKHIIRLFIFAIKKLGFKFTIENISDNYIENLCILRKEDTFLNEIEFNDFFTLDPGAVARAYKGDIDLQDTPQENFRVIFMFKDFTDYNRSVALLNWYDENRNPTLTAEEHGEWKDFKTYSYFMANDPVDKYFEIIDPKDIDQYKNKPKPGISLEGVIEYLKENLFFT